MLTEISLTLTIGEVTGIDAGVAADLFKLVRVLEFGWDLVGSFPEVLATDEACMLEYLLRRFLDSSVITSWGLV